MPEHTVHVEYTDWDAYALLDSGDGQKLERWGEAKIIRPEPKAIWRKRDPRLWHGIDAECDASEQWRTPFKPMQMEWEAGVRLQLRMWQKSKHLGLFPEQEPHWKWISQQTKQNDRVANLFAYTGSASLVAASCGARVTHVDASEPAVKMARSNAAISGLADAPIRWIVEDVVTYLKREQRRGSRYEGILLDPPSFGRGPRGQLWKIEAISDLLEQCASLLSDQPRYVVLTMYNLDASALSLHNLMQPFIEKGAKLQVGELVLRESGVERYLPMSLFARASWADD